MPCLTCVVVRVCEAPSHRFGKTPTGGREGTSQSARAMLIADAAIISNTILVSIVLRSSAHVLFVNISSDGLNVDWLLRRSGY